MTVRIAMWSGPRNISTAMMRAFGNRADTAVIDEPFYAAFLADSGLDHPMRAAVLAAQPTDPAAVVAGLLGPAPGGAAIVYQKHMTHHMRPGFDLGWMAACRNAFLIRDPARVIASYAAKRETVTLEDIGLSRQLALFEREADRLGVAPPVIDADDVLADPERVLRALCAALNVPFSDRMLRWPPGRRATDGVWAAHWYGAVERSTGFARADAPPLPESAFALVEAARPLHERLARHRLAT